MRSPRSAIAASVALALLVAACSSDSDTASTSTIAASPSSAESVAPETTEAAETTPVTDVTDTTTAASTAPVGEADFTVRPGVNQVTIVDGPVGASYALVASDVDTSAYTEVANDKGGVVFRDIPEGDYTITREGESPTLSEEFTVLAEDDLPDPTLYTEQQEIPAGGFGYITMRDGTTLSANVMLPGPADAGPYPTIVEYSGYQPSDPASTTFGQLFNALGFAYVGVNMRGTGCSGGSFLFFERAQSIDGYDVVEAVAAQPWVYDHQVGMGGISYPGISQLFVASTAPPSLAAITPLSVLDDSYRANGYPGGIYNTGFAAEFVQERQDEAEEFGQAWTRERVDGGDAECDANQALRSWNPDFVAETEKSLFYDPATADILAPATFVDQIEVPVFLAGAWQDEQTGGRFPDMLDDFTSSPRLYVDLTNGLHTDSLAPDTFARMVEFLNLYVADKTPSLGGARGVAGVLVPQLFGVEGAVLPAERFEGMSFEDALAQFESEPAVRVLFEQGAGGDVPGAPYPGFVAGFSAWPVPEAVPTSWYLADKGFLATQPQPTGMADEYTADPSALPPSFYEGGRSSDIWRADTVYNWLPIPTNTGVGYATEPLDTDTVVVGGGSIDLWIQSTADDTDLEVTISEVRPDGSEMYIQSGWLRASHRALDEDASTDVLPVQTHAEADAAPLQTGEFTPVRVELFPFAYAFRAGSRIRITVDAPGNSRPVWEFDTISDGETVTIAHDDEHPSKIVLQVVPGVAVPPGVPACGSLRGQPCREYIPAINEITPI